MTAIDNVLQRIKKEVERQVEKWGEQNHPCLDQTLLNRRGGCTPRRMCEEYEIPSENRARQLVDMRNEKGELTYAHIALEEFCESVSEFDPEKRKVEIEQLAAVCVSWILTIERRKNEY